MSTLLWRPLEEANVSDPYGMYAALRRHDPIHLAQTGEYILTKYDDIRDVLKSPSFESGNRLVWLKKGIHYFDHKQEDFRAIYNAMNCFILMLNDDQHLRIRNFIAKSWSNREIDGLIQENINKILKRLPEKTFDFVAEYAQPVPILNIANILGVPVTDYQQLMELGVAMTKTLDLYVSLKDMVMMNEAAASFIDYFRKQVKLKRDKPDEGLLSRLIRKNREDRAGLSEDELVSIGIFLFTAGEETSAGLVSNTLLHLARHPEQLRALRQHPEYLDPAIEEVLRYDSIVQLLGRVSKDDVVIRGKRIPAGATVTLAVGSGNRDEDAFERADTFLISRKPNRHLSFGTGVHYCLGDWLGRRQSQLAMNTFLQAYPRVTVPDQPLTWYKNLAVRRLNSLHVNVG